MVGVKRITYNLYESPTVYMVKVDPTHDSLYKILKLFTATWFKHMGTNGLFTFIGHISRLSLPQTLELYLYRPPDGAEVAI